MGNLVHNANALLDQVDRGCPDLEFLLMACDRGMEGYTFARA